MGVKTLPRVNRGRHHRASPPTGVAAHTPRLQETPNRALQEYTETPDSGGVLGVHESVSGHLSHRSGTTHYTGLNHPESGFKAHRDSLAILQKLPASSLAASVVTSRGDSGKPASPRHRRSRLQDPRGVTAA